MYFELDIDEVELLKWQKVFLSLICILKMFCKTLCYYLNKPNQTQAETVSQYAYLTFHKFLSSLSI